MQFILTFFTLSDRMDLNVIPVIQDIVNYNMQFT